MAALSFVGSYLVRSWRGQVSLLAAIALNFLATYFAIVLLGYLLIPQGTPLTDPRMYLWLAFTVIWFCWMFIGLTRVAIARMVAPTSNILIRILSILILISLAVMLYFVVLDLYGLGLLT